MLMKCKQFLSIHHHMATRNWINSLLMKASKRCWTHQLNK